MTPRWERKLVLALEDFLGELADAVRSAIETERAHPTPRRHGAERRVRSASARRAGALDRQRARAWETLAQLAGESRPVHPTAQNAALLIRRARYRTHPDRTGRHSTRDFLRVQRCAEIVNAWFGLSV